MCEGEAGLALRRDGQVGSGGGGGGGGGNEEIGKSNNCNCFSDITTVGPLA